MTDVSTSAPAAKLHKATTGDVTAATLVQAEMQSEKPETVQSETNVKAEFPLDGQVPAPAIVAAGQKDGGKKRKVALYVAYIGAGYHVSAAARIA